jgi:hypothetical protein
MATININANGIPDGIYKTTLRDTYENTVFVGDVDYSGNAGTINLRLDDGYYYGLARDNLTPSLKCSPLKVFVENIIGDTITIMLMGQSEIEYILKTAGFFNQFTKPILLHSNAVIVTQDGDLSSPIKTVITQAAIDAGEVSYSMVALAEILGAAHPTKLFIIGDGCVGGTSRKMLSDDTTDETLGADGARRYWTDFTSVVDLIESEYGPIQHLIECWYNSDAAYIDNFKNSFWPFYFGINPDETEFTLGTTYAGAGGYQVDHCLWDYLAADGETGRGIFSKANTSWHMLMPMPFCDGPTNGTESLAFSRGSRLEEPARQIIKSLELDAVSQSVSLKTGPSAHITDFNGDIHPLSDDIDGNILFMYPFAAAMLRTAGTDIQEPLITSLIGPDDGTYIDIIVSLPNNGILTTIRELRTESEPSSPSPHQQKVTGLELFKNSESFRRPIFNLSETSYPQAFRGTVEINDAGSGTPKTGRMRVTPEIPFEFGDSISYLRGQATALLLEDRDVPNKLFLDMMVEHIPLLYDNSATYPYEGIAVAPLQTDLAVTVPAPPFAPRAVYSDGTNDGFIAGDSVASNGSGLISLWFRNKDTAWAQLKYLLQLRTSGSSKLQLATSSSNRISFRLEIDGSLSSNSFSSDSNNNGFAANQWYHFLIAYQNGSLVVYVNDQEALNSFIGQPFVDSLNQQGFLSESILRNQPNADYGHLWLSTNQTMDITVQANREKFALSGNPVDVGANGQLPTGVSPEYYFDGSAATWNNKGTLGALTLTGALDEATAPSY